MRFRHEYEKLKIKKLLRCWTICRLVDVFNLCRKKFIKLKDCAAINDESLWMQGIFITYDEEKMVTYVYSRETVRGQFSVVQFPTYSTLSATWLNPLSH